MQQLEQLPFFVYGTLLPGQPNFFLWGKAITGMEPAIFWGGRLYDMGFYPMLVAAANGNPVHGQLISVDPAQYDAVVQRLDELEGYDPTQPEDSEYQRQVVEVVLANGRFQPAWIYLGQRHFVQDKPEVASGDWPAYAAESQPDLQDWWDAISTVANMHKK
jgi:gamma-glutamylcyclotransferase (GGCT)/AIG2-like uncharacterized protein YtfP